MYEQACAPAEGLNSAERCRVCAADFKPSVWRETLLYIDREPGPQNMETVTEKVAKATIPFLKAWNLRFSMMYDGHLTRVAVLSYHT